MKTLKITLLLVAVVLLTVSGQSSDSVVEAQDANYDTQKTYDLLAHAKKNRLKANQG